MNTTLQAQSAYAHAVQPIRTPRSTEYEVFAATTARLRSAARAGSDGFAALAAALHDNRRLWTLLAADVADDGNALPPQLRAQIFYLAEFTNHHTSRVLGGEASPDALIDINAAIMAGLRGGRAAA